MYIKIRQFTTNIELLCRIFLYHFEVTLLQNAEAVARSRRSTK